VIDDPSFNINGNHPVRCSSAPACSIGLWKRVEEEFAPAHIVEFFATTDGQAVLANVSGPRSAARGVHCPAAASRTRRL